MKRPFAVIGFSMLFVTLVFYNISFKASVALTIGATVIFCLCLPFKAMRKNKFLLFSLASVIAFSLTFTLCQHQYITAEKNMGETVEIRGVVCQTPTHSDYAHTYIIKLESENYKVRYVTEDNRFFAEGTIVSGTLKRDVSEYVESDFLDSSLASKVYFTFFETDDFRLERTGETDLIYKTLGEIKSAFTNITYTYLPSENGGIANAMTIGDRSGIEKSTTEQFNYAGSSHLLVVSGLHLSLWAFGVIKLLSKNLILRRYSVLISLAVLLFYSALTGFSVSVIRAGVMVATVIVAKALHRDADSLNSIGAGVTVIMISNPFAAYSVSLWFTVLSTVGILVLQKPLEKWLYSTSVGKKLMKWSLGRFLISSSTVSLSATICTLPVFIVKFEFLPWASVISNILMVDAAMVVMVTTVLGAFFHCLHIYPLAQLTYWVSGTLSGFLRLCAEKIGLAEWSGLPMSNDYYKEILIIMVVCVAFAYFMRKRIPHIIKFVAVSLSIIFILVSFYSLLHDYNTPTVEICEFNSQSIIHINYKHQSVIIGCTDKTSVNWLKDVLNRHGQKSPELLVVTDINDLTFSQVSNYQQTFYFSKVAFCGEGLAMYEEADKNISSVNLGGDFKINLSQYEEYIEFSYNGKNIVYICDETEENPFKNEKGYDTIITYDDLTAFEENEYVKITSGETAIIEF